jgi:DNA-binding PadR family transcriptional regulator
VPNAFIYSLLSIWIRIPDSGYPMTDTKRPFSNPLALAVLVLLYERPMHPYEMATTLRERRKESSIKLNYGSLYTVIEQLLREKLIAIREVLKEGRRPQKTVYQLTPEGEVELIDWMRELVSYPVKEFPQFEAALSLLPVLPPEEVVALLEIRLGLLKKTLEGFAEEEKMCRAMNLPRLFTLESEYAKAIILAEYTFSEGLLSDIKRDAGGLRRMWTALRKTIRGAQRDKKSTRAAKPLATKTRNGGKRK